MTTEWIERQNPPRYIGAGWRRGRGKIDMQYEAFAPVPLAASAIARSGPCSLGGFFCTTGGTIIVYDGLSGAGAPIVNQFACTAGVFYPMPFSCGTGVFVTLGGGAAGTVAVSV